MEDPLGLKEKAPSQTATPNPQPPTLEAKASPSLTSSLPVLPSGPARGLAR